MSTVNVGLVRDNSPDGRHDIHPTIRRRDRVWVICDHCWEGRSTTVLVYIEVCNGLLGTPHFRPYKKPLGVEVFLESLAP